MDSSSNVKQYAWPSTVNVANFVTVKASLKAEGDERSNHFRNWKEQMLCLLESQDVVGFVNGEILPPPPENNYAEWRRTDRLVNGWILGSIEGEVVALVREKPTARDVWLELDNIFKEEEEKEEEVESVDLSRYLALYQAVQRGDWGFAQTFFPDITELSTTVISADSETALHVAVVTGKANDLVKKLVEVTPREALAAANRYGDTALNNAAVVGNTEAAMVLVSKNKDLLYSLNNDERLPVLQAAENYQKETLEYLISICDPNAEKNNPFQGQLGVKLLIATIASGFLDIALDLVEKYPNLGLLTDDKDRSALSMVAGMQILFPRTEYFTWWQSILYHCIPIKKSKRGVTRTIVAGDIENLSYDDGGAPSIYSTSLQTIPRGKLHQFHLGQKVKSMVWSVMDCLVPQVKELREKKTTHREALQIVEHLCRKIVSLPQKKATAIFSTSILKAAENGFSEIVEMIIHIYPEVAFYVDETTKMNIFLVAASRRFQNVINLLHNMSDRKKAFFSGRTDNQGNNLMHLCGKLAPPERLNLVPGAALQMQRELQWFKEMEKFVNPSRRTWKNKEGQTPQTLFTKEHGNLKAEGETWMKDTANACTITAALIATIMFAAAFTVPGGLESTGFPLFSTKPAFVVFAVSDAVALFTSVTSLLMFLAILTSRYAEEDFLYVLPKRLTLGLVCLFVSITFMLVAFCAALYLLLNGHTAWFVVLVTVFSSLPVTSFVLLQFPLIVDVVYSTYGPGIFAKKADRLLY